MTLTFHLQYTIMRSYGKHDERQQYLFKCSQNIAKKSLNDADSFDDCQPPLSNLEKNERLQFYNLSLFS